MIAGAVLCDVVQWLWLNIKWLYYTEITTTSEPNNNQSQMCYTCLFYAVDNIQRRVAR